MTDQWVTDGDCEMVNLAATGLVRLDKEDNSIEFYFKNDRLATIWQFSKKEDAVGSFKKIEKVLINKEES